MPIKGHTPITQGTTQKTRTVKRHLNSTFELGPLTQTIQLVQHLRSSGRFTFSLFHSVKRTNFPQRLKFLIPCITVTWQGECLIKIMSTLQKYDSVSVSCHTFLSRPTVNSNLIKLCTFNGRPLLCVSGAHWAVYTYVLSATIFWDFYYSKESRQRLLLVLSHSHSGAGADVLRKWLLFISTSHYISFPYTRCCDIYIDLVQFSKNDTHSKVSYLKPAVQWSNSPFVCL